MKTGKDSVSLRDQFAGQAIVGLISSPHASQEWIRDFLAESAYRIADSMLAQRVKSSKFQEPNDPPYKDSLP